jgi:hypothetical protein
MIAFYENFPEQQIHENESFTYTLPRGRLQEKLIKVLASINRKTFTFEDFGNPTIPGCTVILEVGIADSNSFTFIDDNEAKRVLVALKTEPFKVMDFFCAIRYYKDYALHRKPLKFDYYLTRLAFEKRLLEVYVFHERGPRYVAPKDLVAFLLKNINEASDRKILRRKEPQSSMD